MMRRREFVKITAGAGVSLALTPALLRALREPGGTLIQRAIPSSGEMLPVVGLSFSNHTSCADPAALREVLKTFADNGGRVFDAMHGNGIAEQLHATFANELGIQNKLFWSTRGTPGTGGPPQPGVASVPEHVAMWRAKLKAPRMDLVMLPAASDPAHVTALKAEKQAGRVRYIGVQVIADQQYARLEEVMRNQPIDFVGVDYALDNRARVEDTILPLALERKIGVMAFFPFGNNGGISCGGTSSNLFARVGNRPLPEWAAEFDAKTWSHFFLKYVISHPAVTVARVGTTKAHHMLDNMGGGVGRLPDEPTRQRMAAFIDALPPVSVPAPRSARPPLLSAAVLDSYVGKYKTVDGSTVTVRRYGSMLTAQVGRHPDAVLRTLSQTRFWLAGSGAGFIEFQPDSAGAVTGLLYAPGSQKIPASRIR